MDMEVALALLVELPSFGACFVCVARLSPKAFVGFLVLSVAKKIETFFFFKVLRVRESVNGEAEKVEEVEEEED